ncbi:tetratricopeptide repeat protein [Caulobacter hibisci]|uniref:Sel1 repeat family protein n=1 Tax=Caulobacter hibisci TaxID=2035993 RepID=A0ABS0ST93_9CAUL|nr:tetratricopeptide repeat protein [Caulobacter hibisci]MBI1682566.1 sel1 repeat family protein [Caulobacter hibisci]
MHEASDAVSLLSKLTRRATSWVAARRWPTRRLPLGVAAAVLLSAPLFGCDLSVNQWFAKRASACPRPQAAQGVSGQFNQQQIEIRNLRQGGFRGDFFAQLELARRYEGQRASDKNLDDPVEAATWYATALANSAGYAPIAAYEPRGKGRSASRFDDCRAYERHAAYGALDRQLSRMSTEEREQVRNRVIYILSTQGADGFRTLARMHDGYFGPYGEPSDNLQAVEAYGDRKRIGAPAALDLFRRNDVDAYLYNYLAVQTGDVSAYVMLKDFERSSPQRASYGGFVEGKAKRWIPPYEFYPADSPDSGVPHSDESDPSGEARESALARLHELPFVHVGEALSYLRIIPAPLLDERLLSLNDAQTFQASIGRPTTGRLTPIEKVRAVQYAAVNGSSKAQLVLAVMYSEGVGVPRDYARAYHWYEEAERQGSPEAKYAMSTFFSLGLQGVADQDRAKAVVYQLDGALAGFKPSVWRLQQLLAQVSRPPRAPGERPRPYEARPYAGPANAGPATATPANLERDYR